MGVDILAAISHLLPETRMDILPLLADSYEERQERARVEKEHRDRRLISIGNSMLSSLTKIAFENRDYPLAEKTSLRREDYFWAARVARMQGRMEEAREYFRAYVGQVAGHNGHIPSRAFFREAKEYFSGDDLGQLLLPLAEGFGGDVPLLIRVFIAKELGDKDFVRKTYRNSKRRLARFHEREFPDFEDMEASAEHHYRERDLGSNHAELCEVLGRFDEAAEFYLSDGLNSHILLYEPFSDYVEGRDDKNEVYERILRNMHPFSSPRFIHLAMAAEKLGQEERAREYYHDALFQEERGLDFAEALKIAERLHLKERAIAYREIPAYLYEQGHI